jgi:hypothetical protein
MLKPLDSGPRLKLLSYSPSILCDRGIGTLWGSSAHLPEEVLIG